VDTDVRALLLAIGSIATSGDLGRGGSDICVLGLVVVDKLLGLLRRGAILNLRGAVEGSVDDNRIPE
jgi:hypothetical protein